MTRIGSCIPTLSKMEYNMIQKIRTTVTFTKLVISSLGVLATLPTYKQKSICILVIHDLLHEQYVVYV
jgi:hypothetical protein